MSRRSLFLAVLAGLLLLLAVSGVFVAMALDGGSAGFGIGDRVAVIEVDGMLLDDGELLEQIRHFRRNPSVKGFVVSINSPGGVVAASQSVYGALRELREEDDRPVIASIGSVGASGGYYVALAADSIYALPGSITGSIGVIMEFPSARELMQKVGVEMEVIKSSEHKDIGSPFREMSETDRQVLQAVVQDVYSQFVDAVVLERQLPREAVLEMADGRVFSGRQALRNGLIDAEGNIQDAIRAAGRIAGLGDEPRVVRPPEPGMGLLELLLGNSAVQARSLLGLGEVGRGMPVLKYVPSF